jgi:F420-dependent oxidoreductase-like protein
MQVGLMIEGQLGLTWARWQKILSAAEDFGYTHVFRSDHFAFEPPMDSLELWVSLTYAASHTKRIEFGSVVTPVTFRHPVITARMAAQVDDLSGGRLVLGLGTGWNEREHRNYGVPFYDWKIRFDMLEDALEITTRLFNSTAPVDYAGTHFSIHDAVLLPPPARPGGPTLLIGGRGAKRTMPLVAKYAREWNIFGPIEEFRAVSAYLSELLIASGRKPSDVKRSPGTRVVFGKTDADLRAKLSSEAVSSTADLWDKGISAGTSAELVERLRQWQEAGAERLSLQWLELDNIAGLEIIARDVLPHFHRQ